MRQRQLLPATRLIKRPPRHPRHQTPTRLHPLHHRQPIRLIRHPLRIHHHHIHLPQFHLPQRLHHLHLKPRPLQHLMLIHLPRPHPRLLLSPRTPAHHVLQKLRMIPARLARQVTILPKQNHPPLPITRHRRHRLLVPRLIRRTQNRKRQLPPNRHQSRHTDLRHRLHPLQNLSPLPLHHLLRNLPTQRPHPNHPNQHMNPMRLHKAIHQNAQLRPPIAPFSYPPKLALAPIQAFLTALP